MADLEAQIAAALAPVLRKLIAEEVAKAIKATTTDDMLPHTEWPLGSRRRCAELARSGAIAGATRRGKVWLARRSAVEAYAAAGMVPTVAANDSDNDSADDDGMLAAIARHARR